VPIRVLQFLAIIAYAPAAIPSGGGLAALRNKMDLSQADDVTVQAFISDGRCSERLLIVARIFGWARQLPTSTDVRPFALERQTGFRVASTH